MPTSRRLFLKSGTLAALAAGFGLKNARLALAQTRAMDYAVPLTAQRESTFLFNKESFTPYVNGIFQAPDSTGRMVNLTLLSVTSYVPNQRTRISTATPHPSDAFSLMFQADRSLPPFTSMHRVSHSALGTFDLFLTPRVGTDQNLYYEAVFNHKQLGASDLLLRKQGRMRY